MNQNSKKKPDFADFFIKWVGTKKSLAVHTIVFTAIFALLLTGIKLDEILLILTTFLSIEAIYLAIFIQITVNKNTESLEDFEEDIEAIQEDDIEEDIHEQEVEKTLQIIEKRLNDLQEDLKILRKKSLN